MITAEFVEANSEDSGGICCGRRWFATEKHEEADSSAPQAETEQARADQQKDRD